MTANNSRRQTFSTSHLPQDPDRLFSYLKAKGAFRLMVGNGIVNPGTIGTRERKLPILRAAITKMWPMGTHFWVRDNALIGDRLINIQLKDKKFSKELRQLGEKLLWSTIEILSTRSQLSRFRRVIESDSVDFIDSASSWPQIFLGIKSNLSGDEPEGWAHKQDAWQILAYSILKHLGTGRLSVDSLTAAHREFLTLIVPFLAKVRFYQQENSGSWEELEAVRSSVVAWELALLDQIYRLSALQKFSFLRNGFELYRPLLENYGNISSFHQFVTSLLHRGALHLEKTIPFECPHYPDNDPRHRKADAALIYLLQLDTPRLVAHILDLPDTWIASSESKLLKAIESLHDARCGGLKRYQKDSYQRVGFFRPDVVKKLAEMYGAPSGDASGGFTGRDHIVPKGPEAAWAHFAWQLSAWAGRRFRESHDEKFLSLQKKYFREGTRMITRPGEHSVEVTAKGTVRAIPIPAYRFTECYLTEIDSAGKQYLFPSPHTPLNWAVAEALDAFSSMRKSTLFAS